MKAKILLAALIVVSVSAYSQTKENTKKERSTEVKKEPGTEVKNEHGTEVNSVAKVQGDATQHGEIVSTVASSKAQGSADHNSGLLHRKDREKRAERPEMTGSKADSHKQGMSGADMHKGTGMGATSRTGIQKGSGVGVSAKTGIQGKISRPGIRSNIRVNAGIRGF